MIEDKEEKNTRVTIDNPYDGDDVIICESDGELEFDGEWYIRYRDGSVVECYENFAATSQLNGNNGEATNGDDYGGLINACAAKNCKKKVHYHKPLKESRPNPLGAEKRMMEKTKLCKPVNVNELVLCDNDELCYLVYDKAAHYHVKGGPQSGGVREQSAGDHIIRPAGLRAADMSKPGVREAMLNYQEDREAEESEEEKEGSGSEVSESGSDSEEEMEPEELPVPPVNPRHPHAPIAQAANQISDEEAEQLDLQRRVQRSMIIEADLKQAHVRDRKADLANIKSKAAGYLERINNQIKDLRDVNPSVPPGLSLPKPPPDPEPDGIINVKRSIKSKHLVREEPQHEEEKEDVVPEELNNVPPQGERSNGIIVVAKNVVETVKDVVKPYTVGERKKMGEDFAITKCDRGGGGDPIPPSIPDCTPPSEAKKLVTIYSQHKVTSKLSFRAGVVKFIEDRLYGKPDIVLSEHYAKLRVTAQEEYVKGSIYKALRFFGAHGPLGRKGRQSGVVDPTKLFCSEYEAYIYPRVLEHLTTKCNQVMLNISGGTIDYAGIAIFTALRNKFEELYMTLESSNVIVDTVNYFVVQRLIEEYRLRSANGTKVVDKSIDYASIIKEAATNFGK